MKTANQELTVHSATVHIELIVNAYPVASQEITADGTVNEVVFDNVKIDRSSWIALRIAFSSHTNPVFVILKDQPIRASRRSAQWCIDGVEQCWKSKERTYKADELADAQSAYDHARSTFRRLLSESESD